MTIIIQLLVFLLIVLSVTLASPGQWEQSKSLIFTGAGLWAGLIILTGVINSLVA
jgi:photosystem II PsbZ protein